MPTAPGSGRLRTACTPATTGSGRTPGSAAGCPKTEPSGRRPAALPRAPGTDGGRLAARRPATPPRSRVRSRRRPRFLAPSPPLGEPSTALGRGPGNVYRLFYRRPVDCCSRARVGSAGAFGAEGLSGRGGGGAVPLRRKGTAAVHQVTFTPWRKRTRAGAEKAGVLNARVTSHRRP